MVHCNASGQGTVMVLIFPDGVMDSLLNNPLVQSAVVPFVIGLAAVLVLRRPGWFWAGLAVPLGFYAAVYLINKGFDFFPLRSTNKIFLCGLAAVVIGLLLDVYRWNRRYVPPLLFVVAGVVALWLVWPRLTRLEGLELWALVVGSVAYVGWLVAAMEGLRDRPLRADSAILTIATGTGLACVLGATALYGQLASAIAAAVGARWVMNGLGWHTPAGSTLAVPAAVLMGMLGIGAVAYAKLPWIVLILLALIPLLARVPLPQWRSWQVAAVTLAMCAVPAALAIYLTYSAEGSPPY